MHGYRKRQRARAMRGYGSSILIGAGLGAALFFAAQAAGLI